MKAVATFFALMIGFGSVQAVTAVAEIRNLKFTLTDLNSSDGINPSYSSRIDWVWHNAWVQDNPYSMENGVYGDGFQGLPAPYNTPRLQALTHGAMSAEVFSSENHYRSAASGSTTDGYANAGNSTHRDSGLPLIILSPFTRLTITGEMEGSISGKGVCADVVGPPSRYVCESAHASAWVFLQNSRIGNQRSEIILTSEPGIDFSEQRHITFEHSFETAEYEFDAVFGLGTGVVISSVAGVVPEPQALALALAGLGALALARRLRRH